MARRRLLTFGTALVILVTGLSFEITSARAAKSEYLVFVGTYTDQDSKGIYSYRFDSSTGKLTPLGLAAEALNPSFLTSDSRGHFLYAVNELDTYQGKPTGAVIAFANDSATGKLSRLNQVSSGDQTTPGEVWRLFLF
jgi:6-phosphogluconolactonase